MIFILSVGLLQSQNQKMGIKSHLCCLKIAAVPDSEAIINISRPNFYDSLEDLEAFLENPTPPEQSPLPDIFESLEAFLSESTAADWLGAAEPLQRLESLEIASKAN
jgi:chemosensory pili system protein ChpA (sensor histidine kinase/response regulator)